MATNPTTYTISLKFIIKFGLVFVFSQSCLFFSLAEEAQVSAPYLSQVFNSKTLQEAQSIQKQVLRFYPPERYHYVFVGRSLTLIRALMEAQGVAQTGLPLRGKSIDLSFSSEFGQRQIPELQNHLRNHLPAQELWQGKELVLLDFTSSGAGLNTAQKLLDWYYQGQQRLHLLRVSTYGSSLNDYLPGFLTKHQSKTIRIPRESMFAIHLLNSNFDSYAGYGTYNLETGKYLDYEAQTLSRYEALKAWLQQKLKLTSSNSCRLFLSQ